VRIGLLVNSASPPLLRLRSRPAAAGRRVV